MNNIELPDSFYEEEVRCDYTVTPELKKVWAVELDLVSELLRVCKKHDIQVFCFAGTLLGAVRHKGFIPWDDDMDVCLTRENFEKLCSFADEFKHPYFLQTALNDQRYFIGYARLRNSDTTGIITWNNTPDYNNGIYIDVFVLDGYVESRAKLRYQLARRSIVSRLLRAYHTDNATGGKKAAITILQHSIFKLVSYEQLYNRYKKIMTMYNKKARNITLLTHGEYFYTRYWSDKKDFTEEIWVPFETIEVPIPKAYDRILKNTYGNYMEFPPVKDRGAWHNDMIIFDPDTPYKEYMARHRGE